MTTENRFKNFVEDMAKECNSYFATQEWVFGTLTNPFIKFHHQVRRDSKPTNSIFTMQHFPRMSIVVNIKIEYKALETLQQLKIPIVAPISLYANSRGIIFIPTNGDSTNIVKFILRQLVYALKFENKTSRIIKT